MESRLNLLECDTKVETQNIDILIVKGEHTQMMYSSNQEKIYTHEYYYTNTHMLYTSCQHFRNVCLSIAMGIVCIPDVGLSSNIDFCSSCGDHFSSYAST